MVKPTSEGPSGLTLVLPTQDIIFHEASPSTLHRDHIVLHELGHLLLDHTVSELLPMETVAAFLPDLSLTLVERVLGRTVYSDGLEQEAELMASIIMRRAGGLTADSQPAGADPTSPVLGRFSDALGGQ